MFGKGEIKMTKGWKSESARHALAAKKIKTGRKRKIRTTKKTRKTHTKEDLKKIRQILTFLYEEFPDLYAGLEKETAYPNNDDFDDEDKYDEAVDRAEFKALLENKEYLLEHPQTFGINAEEAEGRKLYKILEGLK